MTAAVRCVLCGKRAAAEGCFTCDPCAGELVTTLRRIADAYDLVATSPALLLPRRPGLVHRSAPGYGSRSPANDDLIVLTDRRTAIGDDLRAHSVPAAVSQWVRQVAEETGGRPPRPATVADDIHYLLGLRRWLFRQPWIDEFAQEMQELYTALLNQIQREARPVPIGPCPVDLATDGRVLLCGRMLRVRPEADQIRCSACRTVWPRTEWDQLGQALGDPRSDYAQLEAWLGVPAGTLRRWAAKDRWTADPARGRGRATWLRAEALASWTRRHGADPGNLPA
ncbi:hypothetical protein [Crossiella sp. CA198]|uniref:hypothetical protein n=1 Tax=Crossiella sp. CA198 TaxID=3455607 RepID=UPI003F8D84F8